MIQIFNIPSTTSLDEGMIILHVLSYTTDCTKQLISSQLYWRYLTELDQSTPVHRPTEKFYRTDAMDRGTSGQYSNRFLWNRCTKQIWTLSIGNFLLTASNWNINNNQSSIYSSTSTQSSHLLLFYTSISIINLFFYFVLLRSLAREYCSNLRVQHTCCKYAFHRSCSVILFPYSSHIRHLRDHH